jgi:hypothetical protein
MATSDGGADAPANVLPGAGKSLAPDAVGGTALSCAQDAASECPADGLPCLLHLADEVQYVCEHPVQGPRHLEVDRGATQTFVELDAADFWIRSVYDANGLFVAHISYDANNELTYCEVGPKTFDAAESLAAPAYQDPSGDALKARCASVATDAGADASD